MKINFKYSYFSFVLLYILIQLFFAIIYYKIYIHDNNNFFFFKEILNSQRNIKIEEFEKEKEKFKQENVRAYKNYLALTNDTILKEKYLNTELPYLKKVIKKIPDKYFTKTLINRAFNNNDTVISFNYDHWNFQKKYDNKNNNFPVNLVPLYDIKNFYINISSYTTSKPDNLIFSYNYFLDKRSYIFDKHSKSFWNFKKDLLSSLENQDELINFYFNTHTKDVISKYKNQIKEYKQLASATKDVWGFSDFIYFSVTVVGNGDITPNSTLCRLMVALQTIANLILTVVLADFILSKKNTIKKN
ncbi:potassium channel family protein [Flavivirga amylovorans]|uniref:Potassium channel family protein n=1 Tax=Flavivirga amylovorans TaxID=870486 RepID=A0ABT8X5B8_9FLAO|nr:potassium channel family protein [Flavivirga amylovorans]MDO5989186.1 potassium channel family protein [Flavivirga amylovorans]